MASAPGAVDWRGNVIPLIREWQAVCELFSQCPGRFWGDVIQFTGVMQAFGCGNGILGDRPTVSASGSMASVAPGPVPLTSGNDQ